MPPKQPTTDHLLHRITAAIEQLADGLAAESERRNSIDRGIKAILNQLVTDVAEMPQAVAEALSQETLDRLRHVRYWLAQLEQRAGTPTPPPLGPPPPPPPAKDPTQPIPLMVEVHGRWGWNELKPKLWKVVPWVISAGVAGYHLVQWLIAHGH